MPNPEAQSLRPVSVLNRLGPIQLAQASENLTGPCLCFTSGFVCGVIRGGVPPQRHTLQPGTVRGILLRKNPFPSLRERAASARQPPSVRLWALGPGLHAFGGLCHILWAFGPSSHPGSSSLWTSNIGYPPPSFLRRPRRSFPSARPRVLFGPWT